MIFRSRAGENDNEKFTLADHARHVESLRMKSWVTSRVSISRENLIPVFLIAIFHMFTVAVCCALHFDHAHTSAGFCVVERTSSTLQESSCTVENFCRGKKVNLKPKDGRNAIETVMDAASGDLKEDVSKQFRILVGTWRIQS